MNFGIKKTLYTMFSLHPDRTILQTIELEQVTNMTDLLLDVQTPSCNISSNSQELKMGRSEGP